MVAYHIFQNYWITVFYLKPYPAQFYIIIFHPALVAVVENDAHIAGLTNGVVLQQSLEWTI